MINLWLSTRLSSTSSFYKSHSGCVVMAAPFPKTLLRGLKRRCLYYSRYLQKTVVFIVIRTQLMMPDIRAPSTQSQLQEIITGPKSFFFAAKEQSNESSYRQTGTFIKCLLMFTDILKADIKCVFQLLTSKIVSTSVKESSNWCSALTPITF